MMTHTYAHVAHSYVHLLLCTRKPCDSSHSCSKTSTSIRVSEWWWWINILEESWLKIILSATDLLIFEASNTWTVGSQNTLYYIIWIKQRWPEIIFTKTKTCWMIITRSEFNTFNKPSIILPMMLEHSRNSGPQLLSPWPLIRLE